MVETKALPRENLGKLSPCLSLLHDGQSTDDRLIRKDKGEEMKPRTRHSKVDGSETNTKIFHSVCFVIFQKTVFFTSTTNRH